MIALGVIGLLATTAEVIAIYYTPPSYLAEARAMMRGQPAPASGEFHPIYLILLFVAAYTPALSLLLFGMFFRRNTRADTPHSI